MAIASRRPRRAQRSRPTTATHGRVVVEPLGFAVRLDYRRDGKTYTHAFGKRVRLLVTDKADMLIIAPIKVRGRQIHG